MRDINFNTFKRSIWLVSISLLLVGCESGTSTQIDGANDLAQNLSQEPNNTKTESQSLASFASDEKEEMVKTSDIVDVDEERSDEGKSKSESPGMRSSTSKSKDLMMSALAKSNRKTGVEQPTMSWEMPSSTGSEDPVPNFMQLVSTSENKNPADGKFFQTNNVSNTSYESVKIEATSIDSERQETFKLLRDYEKFSPNAYWDVNAWRIGYGQDTVHGQRVYPGMRISRDTAESAMASRWLKLERPALIKQVGANHYNQLNAVQRAVLNSLKWNYGHVPPRVVRAIHTGNCKSTAQAIYTLRTHDRGINSWRRDHESKLFNDACLPPIANG